MNDIPNPAEVSPDERQASPPLSGKLEKSVPPLDPEAARLVTRLREGGDAHRTLKDVAGGTDTSYGIDGDWEDDDNPPISPLLEKARARIDRLMAQIGKDANVSRDELIKQIDKKTERWEVHINGDPNLIYGEDLGIIVVDSTGNLVTRRDDPGKDRRTKQLSGFATTEAVISALYNTPDLQSLPPEAFKAKFSGLTKKIDEYGIRLTILTAGINKSLPIKTRFYTIPGKHRDENKTPIPLNEQKLLVVQDVPWPGGKIERTFAISTADLLDADVDALIDDYTKNHLEPSQAPDALNTQPVAFAERKGIPDVELTKADYNALLAALGLTRERLIRQKDPQLENTNGLPSGVLMDATFDGINHLDNIHIGAYRQIESVLHEIEENTSIPPVEISGTDIQDLPLKKIDARQFRSTKTRIGANRLASADLEGSHGEAYQTGRTAQIRTTEGFCAEGRPGYNKIVVDVHGYEEKYFTQEYQSPDGETLRETVVAFGKPGTNDNWEWLSDSSGNPLALSADLYQKKLPSALDHSLGTYFIPRIDELNKYTGVIIIKTT